MKIIRAEILGFCAGVRKAVEAAEESLDNNNGKVYTYGPLIHNPVALSSLEERGLQVLNTRDYAQLKKNDTVLIRAHGVPPQVMQSLNAVGCTVINATCPRVTVSQMRAADYARKGYTVILAGDQNHGEVTGIAGYADEALQLSKSNGSFVLVQNRDEANALFTKSVPLKAVLLSQTTFSPQEFSVISEIIKQKIPAVELFNTICPATRERQEALAKICPLVDGILVIGGKNSANTNRLYATAQKLCSHVALIERPSEIPQLFYSLAVVGLTAGASTPDSVIDAVENKLKNI